MRSGTNELAEGNAGLVSLLSMHKVLQSRLKISGLSRLKISGLLQNEAKSP